MSFTISRELIDSTLNLAADWQRQANQVLTSEEKTQQEQMQQLLDHPGDKVTLVKMFDQGFRSQNPDRAADQLRYLLKTRGIPEFFSKSERRLLALFRDYGQYASGLAIPRVIARMRQSSRDMIIDGEPGPLHSYLKKRKSQGLQVNVNRIGEEVLGEDEAARRLDSYINDLQNPLIEQISVKISTIFSQINRMAFNRSVEVLSERLERLFDTARKQPFERADGSTESKMVNLDMEAYHDLTLTVEAFKRILDQPDFLDCSAGIALQAYLPESYTYQQDLTKWAIRRIERGGSPIKIRLVKGANLEMEMFDAALHDWPLATYDNKKDVDANFKRMVMYGTEPDHAAAVHLGVASHNLFELAFAYQAAKEHNVNEFMVFEMLEGMADHVRRALNDEGLPVLLYAPVAGEKEFLNAIAYLVRRMDENTGPDNFLRHAPNLEPDSETWKHLADQFRISCERLDVREQSNRTQNRLEKDHHAVRQGLTSAQFHNEPDTDWSLRPNQEWAQQIVTDWCRTASHDPVDIPLVVGGKTINRDREIRDIIDPNQVPEKVLVAQSALASQEDIDNAVSVSRKDPDGWRGKTPEQRHEVLQKVAKGLREARADLIGAAAANTGKIFSESDVEVSEAIDFAEYYPISVRELERHTNLEMQGKGVGVVISPWNFPIAIPCGGLLASLAAGNTVIFKPSSEAILSAWILANIFWDAGVSRNTLQFVPCRGGTEGKHLIGHPDVDFVILTGGTDTALNMLEQRPDLFLAAETGGKNSTIVTAMADREQAVRHVVTSAFGNCGQKCSATSLLILENEVYEDPNFRRMLVDAAKSLSVGSAWDLQNRMGPLIHPPKGVLQRGLTQLESGESWALEPKQVRDNPYLWTPGIKWDVQPGSFTHMTELFGPVLGVMKAENLDHAIELTNQTGYGLTAGIESLDPREVEYWKENLRAGNLYVNRTTTGAITLRQPFGGMGKSAVGPTVKVGNPNYVKQFMTFKEVDRPEIGVIPEEHPLLALAQRWRRQYHWENLEANQDDILKSIDAIESYLEHASEFIRPWDYFHLRGQDNQFRHLPVGEIAICMHPDDNLFEVIARVAAGLLSGCDVIFVRPPELNNQVTRFLDSEEGDLLLEDVEIRYLNEDEMTGLVKEVDRLRYAAPDRVPEAVYKAAAEEGKYIARAPVLMDGSVELVHYFLGQSICNNYHRYGNIGERALERGNI